MEGRIIEEDVDSHIGSRVSSLADSKKSLLKHRLKHNQSHEPHLKNNYSFITSNYDSERLKSKLMDYDVNKTMVQGTLQSNKHLNKTSLILPPLSVGNMQKNLGRETQTYT